MNIREENSACSSYAGELSLPSSFAGSSRGSGGGAGSTVGIESSIESQMRPQDLGNIGAVEVYSGQGQVAAGVDSAVTSEDDGVNSEDQLALQISKETKPMMHLLGLLKEIDNGSGNQSGDPKSKAVASLISDFEQELSLIEHKIKGEIMIMNGEQPPLPPNWIALEANPGGGDIYYANEVTGETQWERPGLINQMKERMDDMQNNSNISNNLEHSFQESLQRSGMSLQHSNASNNYEQGSMHSSNRSNDHQQESMQGSNRSNDYHQENLRSSNASDDYHQESVRGNSASNNYNNLQGVHQSNMSRGSNSVGNNHSENLEGSHSDMTNTFESSLTDSAKSNLSRELPPDWIALEDPDSGETYYANEVTGESTWDKPEKQSMPQLLPEENHENTSVIDNNGDDLPPDWIALEDADSGDTYYLNQATMATTWDRPSNGNPSDDNVGMANTDETNQHQSRNEASGDNNRDEDLPPGWEAILDSSSGDYYYSHESTGETQWERPELSQSQSDLAPDNVSNQQGPSDDENDDELPQDENLPIGWFAAIDEDSGDQYYCNEATGETTWDFPTEPAMENGSPNNPNQAPVGDDEHDDDDDDEHIDEEDDDDLLPGWFAAVDVATGDPYFCNEETGETTWDRPVSSATSGNNIPGQNSDENLMSRLSVNDNTVYEDDDSVTSSQY